MKFDSLDMEGLSDFYSLGAWFGSNSTSFSKMRLAYFLSRKSAKTSPYTGNILNKSRQLGASSAVGFYNLLE